MSLRRWGITGLLAVAGVAFWLLLAGPSKLLGVDTGQAGTALLVTVAWVSMYAVSRLPQGELDAAASPAEWKAWIGAGFMLVAVGYFLAKIEVFAAAKVLGDPDASAVARNLVLLLVAWTILSSVMASRWKGEVEEDERDRAIAARAAGIGRIALIVCVIGLAVTLGLSPAEKLQWANHFLVANLLVMAVMWGCLFEYVSGAVLHWRARR
jgi:uncharacterized membrane protein YidH (DUF202 family)